MTNNKELMIRSAKERAINHQSITESIHITLSFHHRSDKGLMISEWAQGATLMPLEQGVILEMADDYLPPFTYGAHEQVPLW